MTTFDGQFLASLLILTVLAVGAVGRGVHALKARSRVAVEPAPRSEEPAAGRRVTA